MAQTEINHLIGESTGKENLEVQEQAVTAKKAVLTVKEKALVKGREKLVAEEMAVEKEKEQLAKQVADIALKKKLAKLTPREMSLRQDTEKLAIEANVVRGHKNALIEKEKAIRKEKAARSPQETAIKNQKDELTLKLKAINKQEARLSSQLNDIAIKKQPGTSRAQIKAIKKQKTKLNPRAAILKKKYGGLHPESVATYLPEFPLFIPTPNQEDEYGTLTDESPYSEYAWAFLRRNRFYQRLVDKGLPNLTKENWEYADGSEDASPIGLVHQKHYRERFADGTRVEWWGIHTFKGPIRMAARGPQIVESSRLDWPKTQVLLIFDVGPLLGDNTTAIDLQIDLAKVHLRERAKAAGISFPEKIRSPDKKLLRAQLRVADLLSSPQLLPRTAKSGEGGGARPIKKADKLVETWLTVTKVADLLPKFDLKRVSPNGNVDAATKAQRVNRASELVVGAWDNIYNWKFLPWLQFDNWDHLVMTKPKSGSVKQDASTMV